MPGKNNEITPLLWINNFDFVCILPIAPNAAQWSIFGLKEGKYIDIERAVASIIGRHKNTMPLHDHETWEGSCMHGRL